MEKNIMTEIINEVKGIKDDIIKTDNSKYSFINEIKNGLGEKIKERPLIINVIKEPLSKKISNFFDKLFTKF